MLSTITTFAARNAVPLVASAIGGLFVGGINAYCSHRINKISDNYLSELEEELLLRELKPEAEATAK